jgi:hypothetical protein
MEFTDPSGETVRIDVTDGTYTRTVNGAVVDTHPATAEEASNFGPAATPVPQPPALAAARQGIGTLHADVPTFQAQLQADIQTVTAGWQTLTAQQQTDLMLRILNGFGSAMAGLIDHATVTGAIPLS